MISLLSETRMGWGRAVLDAHSSFNRALLAALHRAGAPWDKPGFLDFPTLLSSKPMLAGPAERVAAEGWVEMDFTSTGWRRRLRTQGRVTLAVYLSGAALASGLATCLKLFSKSIPLCLHTIGPEVFCLQETGTFMSKGQ